MNTIIDDNTTDMAMEETLISPRFYTTNYKELDISEYDKTFVKLFVVNKSKEEMFDKFVNRLHNYFFRF